MRLNKKKIVFILIVLISIGFATISAVINFYGNFKLIGGKVELVIDNVVDKSNGTDAYLIDYSIDGSSLELSMFIDYGARGVVEFDVTNNGNKDAELKYIDFNNLPEGVRGDLTLIDGSEFYNGYKILAGETLRLHTHFLYDQSSEIIEEDITKPFSVSFDFKAVDSSNEEVIEEPSDFSSDSWATIVNAIRNNNTDMYNVGDVKYINFNGEMVGLRIANKSVDERCGNEDFSETTCGFVLEFTNIIYNHSNVPHNNHDSYGDLGLSKTNNGYIYYYLPEDLRKYVLDTTVITDHFDRTDKLYYKAKLYSLDAFEIYDNVPYTNNEVTRQLDYYRNLGVSANYEDGTYIYAGKEYLNYGYSNAYSLRNINFSVDRSMLVLSDGALDNNFDSFDTYFSYYISPAFRIG